MAIAAYRHSEMDRDERKVDRDLQEQQTADRPDGPELPGPSVVRRFLMCRRNPAPRPVPPAREHLGATQEDREDGLHPSVARGVVRIRIVAPATFVHRSPSSPNTRSHRQSDPSPKSAGSWIQGTKLPANPGARKSAKL